MSLGQFVSATGERRQRMISIEDAIRYRRFSKNYFDQNASSEDERVLRGLVGQRLVAFNPYRHSKYRFESWSCLKLADETVNIIVSDTIVAVGGGETDDGGTMLVRVDEDAEHQFAVGLEIADATIEDVAIVTDHAVTTSHGEVAWSTDRFQAVVLDFGGRYLVFDKGPWFGTDIHCIACDDYMTELMDDRADWETDVEETPDGAYGLDCEVRWLAHPANTTTIRVVREGDL